MGGAFAETSDRHRLFDGGSDDVAGFIDLLGQSGAVPLWVADLSEAVSGLEIDDKGVVRAISAEDQRLRLAKVKSALDVAPKDRWSEFGRWYLSGESDPLISPYSKVRRSELSKIREVVAARYR